MGLYVEGDVPYVANGNCNNNNNGWNDWSWIIGLAVVGGIFGNGGFGFGGGNNRANCATQADLAAGFNNSAVLSSLNDIKLGQASAINYNNQGFAGLNTAILQGFNGVDNAVCTLGYQQAQGFNTLGSSLASCCCDIRQAISDCCCSTKGAIADVKYANERNTCSIIEATNANTRAILDFLTNEKIEGLRAENTALKGQISNDMQTRSIVNELRDGCPIPAFLTCNPRAPYGYGYGYGYGNNSGCCGTSVL